MYGCEIFTNCNNHDKRKLNLAYNNISRYVYLKGRQDHISHSAYQIYGLKFDNLLKIRCLILFHKIFNTGQPEYLLGRIKFDRSLRGMKIIQQRYTTLLSQRQFFIHAHKSLEFSIKLHLKVWQCKCVQKRYLNI